MLERDWCAAVMAVSAVVMYVLWYGDWLFENGEGLRSLWKYLISIPFWFAAAGWLASLVVSLR